MFGLRKTLLTGLLSCGLLMSLGGGGLYSNVPSETTTSVKIENVWWRGHGYGYHYRPYYYSRPYYYTYNYTYPYYTYSPGIHPYFPYRGGPYIHWG